MKKAMVFLAGIMAVCFMFVLTACEPDKVQITVFAVPPAGGSVTGGGSYNVGEDVIVTAAANEGYLFIDWKEGGSVVSTEPTFMFTAEQNIILTAHFEEVPISVTDIDGNIYDIVRIGNQFWMAENLQTTKYNDGTPIHLVINNEQWAQMSTPAYCFYDNDEANKEIYGAMYNWFAVDTGNLCPTGWKVPSDDDWTQLTDHLGGADVAGGKMKATGTIEEGTGLWAAPNEGATNESGFTGLPGGYRQINSGKFVHIGDYGYFWSFVESVDNIDNALCFEMRFDHSKGRTLYQNKLHGWYVRCIKE